jgi:hypothetical protein
MRKLLIKSLIGSSLLALGWSVQAQEPPRYDPYDNRANFQDFQNAQSLFRQVRSDLDRAENNHAYFGDHYWFERVRGELSELQRQWDENEYTPRQTDKVIVALQRVVSENQLSFRDRDRLMDDLSRMRDFFATHDR